eukprot:2917600-Pyramimonas_sp.AAC.1
MPFLGSPDLVKERGVARPRRGIDRRHNDAFSVTLWSRAYPSDEAGRRPETAWAADFKSIARWRGGPTPRGRLWRHRQGHLAPLCTHTHAHTHMLSRNGSDPAVAPPPAAFALA